jgi:RNA polymerase sigma factor (sigma-70 family)
LRCNRHASIADDVVSETFLVAWRRLDDAPASPLPWLIGIARNVRLNARRGARRQAALAERLSREDSNAPVEQPSPDGDLVRAALASLSERDREVLLLSAWDDLDRDAIAAVLGCSKANVGVRLHRARRRFAAALGAANPGLTGLISSSPASGGADVSL